jgi:hypothetical protein
LHPVEATGDVEHEVIPQTVGQRPEHADPEASNFPGEGNLRKRASLIRRELHPDSPVV